MHKIRSPLMVLTFFIWMVFKQRFGLIASGIAPGPGMLAATVGALLVLSPWVLRAAGRRRMAWLLTFDFVLTFLLYADILYFRQFGDLTSIASLRHAHQLGTVAGSVTALMQPADLLLWMDLPLLLVLTLVPAGVRWLSALPQRGLSLRAAASVALAGVAMVALVAGLDPILSQKYYGHSMVASRLGLLNYHAFDAGAYLGRLAARAIPSGEAVASAAAYFGPPAPPEPVPVGFPLAGVAKGKNVIVIQWESMQAFPMDLRIGGQEVTPNLNRLARESITFTDFYHQTGQGVTADADLLANCSLFPTRTGAVYYDFAHNDYRCMPELLREQGYKAVAFQGMPPDFWNLATVYPNVGFEQYYNLKDGLKLDEKLGIGLSDASFFRQTAAHLKTLPQPYYAFVVSLTSHGPFNFEGLPKVLDLGALEGTDMGHYLHAVHYTDRELGKFLDQLEQDGMLDNAVLAVYGDHAGIFRKQSGVRDLLQIAPDDEVGLTRMEKRVPFLIRLPGGAQAGPRVEAAGQADIAPTLAGLLGLPLDTAFFMGRDLLKEQRGAVPFYTGSALDDELLFWSKDGNPLLGRCFERASGAEVAVERCQSLAVEAADKLAVSRLLVTRNLIPELLKSKAK